MNGHRFTLSALVLVVAGLFGGCGGDGDVCAEGADSAEAAVTTLLAAADDRNAACRVLDPDVSVDDGLAWAESVTAGTAVADLTVSLRPGEQMGAEHRVSISAEGQPIAEVAVLELTEGDFLVSP